ncbi:MAG: AAA family ATPase, partial [Planctomycetota bacterium]
MPVRTMPTTDCNAELAKPRVFPTHPRLDRYFPSATAEDARARINACLTHGDGPAVAIGAAGSGKSMLREVLAHDAAAHRLRVVLLAGGQLCTRRALLQTVLHGLGAEYRGMSEGELRIALGSAVSEQAGSLGGVALFVDEAHRLPVALLDELRGLSDIALDGTPHVRLVLIGAHSLDETLTAPELDALSQRVATRCYLEPLSRAESAQYVRAHVAAGGYDPDALIADDAYEAIALATDGLPRLINQVCERALGAASGGGVRALSRDSIGEAWSDLNQLAAPWHSPAAAALAEEPAGDQPSCIEFGSLESPEDAVAAEPASPPAAVWDADRGLAEAAESVTALADIEPDETVVEPSAPAIDLLDDCETCIAFPIRPGTEANETPEPRDETPAGQMPDETADRVEDPFAEAFDEEEVVLDPYAERETIIPAAPTVAPLEDSSFSRAYQAITELADAAPAAEATAGAEGWPAKPATAEPVIAEPVTVE